MSKESINGLQRKPLHWSGSHEKRCGAWKTAACFCYKATTNATGSSVAGVHGWVDGVFSLLIFAQFHAVLDVSVIGAEASEKMKQTQDDGRHA